MPTRWTSYPVDITGGLITNISPIQLGLKFPGAARNLTNFEPSIQGGYRRINGYTKYDSNQVPRYGEPKVQGSGQTGTTLVVGNLLTEPTEGDTFTIDGVTGTYTIDTGGVSYSDTNKEATLTLTSSLASSPADKADITFSEDSGDSQVINGVYYWEGEAYAFRDDSIWKSAGSGWTKISKPDHGTVLVNGGSQTGTSLIVDGLDDTPRLGDTFTIDGVEKVYAVISDATVTDGGATLSIYPALASSPADNAAITFISSDRRSAEVVRVEEFNFDGTKKIVFTDGENYPFIWDGTSGTYADGSTDALGAKYVAQYTEHLFFAKGANVYFTEPFDADGFETASGAGSFRVPADVTGMLVFRDQLIVFTEKTIHKLTGDGVDDFTLNFITTRIGCVQPNTIQEVGGDVAFLGPDGIRLLSATERIGDFGLAVISRNIQPNMTDFAEAKSTYCSCVVREKSQYRIFGFVSGRQSAVSEGYLATQFLDQASGSFSWSMIKGIKANVAVSVYEDQAEVVLFAEEDGYVYRMESGNTFDGTTIEAQYYTPYLSMEDPVVRKTIYKTHSYFDPEGAITGSLNLRFDLNAPNKIQPGLDTIQNNGTTFALYGSAVYGSGTYSSDPASTLVVNQRGSGFTVSLEYEFTSDDPFVLDTIFIEYDMNDRR